MKTSFQIAAFTILLISGPIFGASSMTYTLELGGDNHAAAWETGANEAYTRGVNGDQDGKVYNAGDNINWAVLVEVAGAHSNPGGLGDGLVPGGAANMVFDLELRLGSAAGPLVQVGHATVVNGQATSAGFWSSINDGDCEGTRCSLEGNQPSPELNAAYAIAFDVNNQGANGGRLFDQATSGGPFVDFYHYPSAAGLPANSTAPLGALLGMGAGYSAFTPLSVGGQNSGGVGLTANSGQCIALGIKPIFEGQINTSGLAAGTYVLVLNPGAGNNVLPGHSGTNPICTFGTNGRFAMAPNSVVGDTITFQLAGGCPAIALQTAQSVKTHGGAGTFGLDILSGSRIEPRNGAITLEATYNVGTVQIVGAVTASSGSVVSSAAGNKITVTVTGATINVPLTVAFTAGDATPGCSSTTATSLCVRPVPGDSDRSGAAQIFDLVQMRNVTNTVTNASTFIYDIDASGSIQVFDVVIARNNLNIIAGNCP